MPYRNDMMTSRCSLLVIAVLVALGAATAACSSRISSDVGQECSQELSAAEAELNRAKADGFGDAVSVTKAASLIAAASVQKQFEKYEGCIDKAKRAREYIADVKKN